MSHLGERVASLVDGQLTVEAAERATMHLTGCRDCRDAVERERLVKQRLAALAAPEPADLLVRRLLELAGPSGPLPPRSGHVPGSPRPDLIASLGAVGAQGGPARSLESRGPISRPPGRRGSSRPPLSRAAGSAVGLRRMVRVSRSSRNRVAAAMVGAACLVGAGVAGGVANGGVASTRVVPPIDSLVREHAATSGRLPLSDQSVVWGSVGARK